MHRHLDKRDPRRTFPAGLKVQFLGPDKAVQSQLTGKFAVEQEGKQIITVRDSVILLNTEREMLETDELIWDKSTNRMYTKQFVRITTEDEQITGYGFEADRDFKYWKILVPQGSVRVNPNALSN